MAHLERIILGVLFIIGIVAADHISRRVKALEADLKCIAKDLRFTLDTSYAVWEDYEQYHERLKALEAKCLALAPCACPAKPSCCTKDCQCCRCEQPKPPAMRDGPKFCRFSFIVISDGMVSFAWIDTSGGQHESRMTLREFEGWDVEAPYGKCGCCPDGCKCGCPAGNCPCVDGKVRCKSRACKCAK